MRLDRLSRYSEALVRSALGISLFASMLGAGGSYASGLPHETPPPAPACVEDGCGPRCQKGLEVARRHTARFLREEAALAAGFLPDPVCVAVPGVGGMGIHYTNSARMTDNEVDPRRPEILLYEEQPNGQRRLIAVEYHMPVLSDGQPWFGDEPPPTIDNPPPVLFGHTFDGPMPGHNPAMPWHYDLHVWVWEHNPAGTFAQFNPRVRCP